MDKKFIEDNNFNEAIKHFQHLAEYKYPKQSLKKLYEYSFIVNEAGDDNQQPQQGGDMNQGQMPPQNGAPDAQNQMGGMDGQMGGQMPPDGAGMPQNGGDMMQPQMDGGMGQDGGQMPMDGQMPPMDGQQPMDGEMPMGDDMGGDMPQMDDMGAPEDDIETTEMEGEDEVIDVDDLTQSQEATEYKIDGVNDKLTDFYKLIKDFSKQLEKNEKNIIDLKKEFEERNPTQTEKFNLRSQASGPFNQTASDYWDKVAKENPNYEIIRDNEVSPSEEQKKYEITRDDIDGLNMKSISDTLNMDQDLKKYIGF